jgi:nucleoid DNA-binding protein
MNKAEFINFLHLEYNLQKNDCKDIVEHFINGIVKALKDNDKIVIEKFGTFRIRNYKERKVFDNKNKTMIKVNPFKNLKFVPSINIKKSLNMN